MPWYNVNAGAVSSHDPNRCLVGVHVVKYIQITYIRLQTTGGKDEQNIVLHVTDITTQNSKHKET
jgi:hypothetical protein